MEKPIDNEVEQEFNDLMKLLNKHKRTAFIPTTEAHDQVFSADSKIGGLPYLRHENDWPTCPNCQKHMQLFLQLNQEHLPNSKATELIQLFYCTTTDPLCETDLEAFIPFSEAVVCRQIEIKGPSAKTSPEIESLFDEKRIAGWTPKDDYPHPEEYEQLGIDFELDDEVYDLMEERGVGLAIQKDKLYGWPHWIQGVEYPFDRKTEKQMELVFQLDSHDNLPFMFGDVGIGHVTQSPENPQELAFAWACS